MKNILIVEDDKRSAEWISIYLKRSGFTSRITGDGITGIDLARSGKFDLALLDVMLPGMDGMELCRNLRKETDLPIIMLTAMGTKNDKIKGLDRGADDYITKPFNPDELILRIKAVLRRSGKMTGKVLHCGPLSLDEDMGRAEISGSEIKLSRAQFAILAAFMKNPDRLFTREQFIGQVFNNNFDGYDRTIDTQFQLD